MSGGEAIVFGVDGGDMPAIPVAHRVLLSRRVVGVAQRDGHVVLAADDEVAYGNAVPARPLTVGAAAPTVVV